MKLVVPLKVSTVLFDAKIAPPEFSVMPTFSRKIVFPVNVTLLLCAVIALPGLNHHVLK